MSDEPNSKTPDIRDGLNQKERAILHCLNELEKERRGRAVPTAMLYGRVLELVDLSEEEFKAILSRFNHRSSLK